MTSSDKLTEAEEEFLAKCEEELKDRFTEKDEEFMKVFNAEPAPPPIVESWWVPRRNDRFFNNRRSHPYERPRDNNRRNDNRRDYGYSHGRNNDRGYRGNGNPHRSSYY